MYRTFFSLILTVSSLAAYTQADEEYVRFHGKTLNARDSSTVSATMIYEKLPYYDDMGMTTSSSEGVFEFHLVKGNEYNFKINTPGFTEYSETIAMSATANDGSMSYNFYVEPETEPDLITLENLIFSRGSDRITESSYTELDNLVKYLDERPSIVIQLEGHTDFAGNADANMRLSQARVEAVKEYLASKGVKKSRVLTKAFGGTQPLFTERTDEAKTKNRRVEVRVIRR